MIWFFSHSSHKNNSSFSRWTTAFTLLTTAYFYVEVLFGKRYIASISVRMWEINRILENIRWRQISDGHGNIPILNAILLYTLEFFFPIYGENLCVVFFMIEERWSSCLSEFVDLRVRMDITYNARRHTFDIIQF